MALSGQIVGHDVNLNSFPQAFAQFLQRRAQVGVIVSRESISE